MNISSLIPPAMVEQGKQLKAALKELEFELSKGVHVFPTKFPKFTI